MKATCAPACVLARSIAECYSRHLEVEAVALAGSLASGTSEPGSDIDLYVYSREELPVEIRMDIATARASRIELDNRFWEPGDEWVDGETGIHVDVMFRTVDWIEDQLARVLKWHEASVGYSTCLWHNVLASQALFDRSGWFRDLQQKVRQPYPEALRRAIVAKNHPILRQNLSSYRYQIERAAKRDDLVSLNHRVAALLASYFDILFAVNRVAHPGEKRLLEIASATCEKVPERMGDHLRELIGAVSAAGEGIAAKVDALLSGLDELLRTEGFDLPDAGPK